MNTPLLRPVLRHAPRRLALTLTLAAAAVLAGCATAPTPADYADQQPRLDLKTYFNGPLVAHGMFTDRSGKVIKRFVVQLTGSWQGNQGTLDERFTYSDGTKQQRIWHLTDEGGGRYTGRAADIVGVAQGVAAGNALNWHYTLRQPVGDKTYDVQMDDWMILIDEHVMLNRTAMSKFGFHLGDVTLAFNKP